MTARLRVGIDVGGTFTDVAAIDERTRRIVARGARARVVRGATV